MEKWQQTSAQSKLLAQQVRSKLQEADRQKQSPINFYAASESQQDCDVQDRARELEVTQKKCIEELLRRCETLEKEREEQK